MQESVETLHGERGTYRAFDWVGGGGFGSVLFGRELGSNRPVALKRLHAHFVHEPRIVARFEREADLVLVRGLRHPNLVRILDRGRDDHDVPFLVMEWIDGRTVANLLTERGTAVSIPDAAAIGCQVLQGLAAAHALTIVHRDIKPSNLMVTADGRVIVMDLGIAKETDPDVSSLTGAYSAVPATLQYAAPEQLSGDRAVDARTDLYALGATLYLLLSGRAPFNGPARPDPPPLQQLRPETDGELAAIVKQALAYEPSDRFATANDMLAALRPFAPAELRVTVPTDNEPHPEVPAAGSQGRAPTVADEPTAVSVPPPRRTTNSVIPMVIGGLALLVVIVVVGIALVLRQAAQDQQNTGATATAIAQASATSVAQASASATAQTQLVKLPAPGPWPVLKNDLSGMSYTGDDAFATWTSFYEKGILKYVMYAKTDATYPVPIQGSDVGQTFHYAVSAKQVSGPPTASYGMLVLYPFGARAADASTNYYEFVIDDNSDGRFAVRKDNVWKTLWQSNALAAVKAGDTNAFVLHAESVTGGTHFSLFLNGQYVTDLIDDELSAPGAVGVVMVLAKGGDGASWEFSNLELRAPTP